MPVYFLSAEETGFCKKITEIVINRIILWLEVNNCISKGEEEIVRYGLEQGLSALVGMIVILLTGYVMGVFIQSCIFIVLFIPLRMYAGGYHASTRSGCALVSFVLVVLFFSIIRYCNFSMLLVAIIAIIEFLLLYFLIPVDGNYPLELVEKQIYRRRGQVILFLYELVFSMMFFGKCYIFLETMMMTLSMILFLVLCGKAKIARNKFERRSFKC